jgi:predicted DNA-binding protein (UPF0251 family)
MSRKKTKVLNFKMRISEYEDEMFEQLATAMGMSKSAVVIHLITVAHAKL